MRSELAYASPSRVGVRQPVRDARGGGGLPRPWRGRPPPPLAGRVRPNYDSPREPSIANSGAFREDGRKNPSVGFL